MKVVELIENEDGSCDCHLTLTSKEAETLIGVGFTKLLMELVDKQSKIPALLKEKQVG
jgi:hypothetical protein